MSNSYPTGRDVDSTRSEDDRLPMNSFLHTIPEGSSDIGGASTSAFNPAAVAALSTEGGTTAGKNDVKGSWGTFPLGIGSQSNPARPGSVTSSTRAIEAGRSSSQITAYGGSGMDGSLTAVAGQGDDAEQADPEVARSRLPIKRRRSSVMRANKKKVGVVCLFATVLVIVVIVALVVIVKSLDKDDETKTFSNSSSAEAELVNGTNANATQRENTLAPTMAVSTYGFGGGTGNTSLQEDYIADDDDAGPAFDDNVSEESVSEEMSLLVQLDEAIYMLYSADNMLPHVSAEVFTEKASARYQARDWLLNNDTLLQTTIMESATSSSPARPLQTLERIAQRYIMLVFYFSTLDVNNTSTNSSVFTITPDIHECYWVQNACGQDDTDTGLQVQSMAASTSTTSNNNQLAPLESEIITYLNVSFANLIGTLPFELGYLSGLRELTIHGNQLTGTIPLLLLTQLQFLYVMDLSQNSFQGTIPPELWTMPTLRFAYLHGNQFTGTIPQELSESPSSDLEEIWLRDNRLSGSIPEWWTELPNLDVLSVRNNSWTGQLPKQWEQAQKLEFFDASYAQLTGGIPSSLLYGIPALQHLYLDYNGLVGTLPTIQSAEEDMITVSRPDLKMQALWLQHNQLTGTIPDGFARDWSRLQELELYENQFVGVWECMEDGTDVWPQLEELAVDCLSGPSLEQAGQKVNSTQTAGGVDMSLCDACCIQCY